MIEISVVIPTRNRKQRVLEVLHCLQRSVYPVAEVLIVDASDVPFTQDDAVAYTRSPLRCMHMSPGVCPQRNAGIRAAASPWILLCDDDIELPPDYIGQLAAAVAEDPAIGAVTGLVMQQEAGQWVAAYPVRSGKELFLKYCFGLGIWGEIQCDRPSWPLSAIAAYYARRGNHLTAAGWPVLTRFQEPAFDTPLYGLGAALIRRDWLLQAPFDEVLDPHGIGDNFGVIQAFPVASVRVLTTTSCFHHQEPANRLQRATIYYRRALALDYFRRNNPRLTALRRHRLLWSLFGNFLIYTMQGDRSMRRAAWKSFSAILLKPNPYFNASKQGRSGVAPEL